MPHGLKIKKVIQTRTFKAGYVVRHEIIAGEGRGPDIALKFAYNLKGQFIGDSKTAHRLISKKGIMPELADAMHKTCSIGFCEKEQKWYGWSHRAIVGFGVGDKIFVERFGDDFTPFVKHGPRPITNMREAKLAAKRFARSVS